MNLPHLVYLYGMRCRGFSPGCQPKDGLISRMDDVLQEYHDMLVYRRKLTDDELSEYELDFLGERWYRGDDAYQ